MKRTLTIIFCALAFHGFGQRFKTEKSHIRFFSDAPMEDIEAVNENASSIVDVETKAMVIVIPIKDFEFEKSLMEEHFNENYLETEKYPKATFKGKIIDWDGSFGTSKATAEGTLELHGVTKDVKIEGEIDYSAEKMSMSTVFMIKLEDYKVKIPKAVFYNIAEEVEVTAKFDYMPYEKN